MSNKKSARDRIRTDPRMRRRRVDVERARRRRIAGWLAALAVTGGLVWVAFFSPLLDVTQVRLVGSKHTSLDDVTLVGSSPEVLVRVEGDEVTVRPIAGTRPRGARPAEDEALATSLRGDAKELAEHRMLVDLGRNDIGRVARYGTVRVTESLQIERYSHVQHLVSEVRGRLSPGHDALDVFRACFPAGTVSGAPKVRAMEIIDELEPVQRGIYGGACGYLSFAGDMDVAIAIRTGIVKDETLYVQAAAGVVADSVPELEWKETEAKARAVLRELREELGDLPIVGFFGNGEISFDRLYAYTGVLTLFLDPES